MALSQSADIRSLLGGGAEGDRLATSHFLIGSLFLVIGGLLEFLTLFTRWFADVSPLNHGRLESMANLSLMIGFAVVSLLGGVYYVLPRLTGTRLWNPNLARGGLLAISSLVVAGLVMVGFGLGDGRPPFGVPWWVDAPMAAALMLPAVVVVSSVARRRERRSFVTIWFVLGGVTWLPLLYLTHLSIEITGISSVTRSYTELFFTAGFLTMFVITVGTGLAYYTIVKEVDIPLASRQLGIVGFWSLGFAGVWWGTAQMVFGPGPTWVAGVAAALGLAFPMGALANAANVSLTLEGHWDELRTRPGVTSLVLGLYMAIVVALMASLASFPTLGSVTALTSYWDAVEYAALLGVGTLLIGGVTIQALPRTAGKEPRTERIRAFNRYTLVGVGGVLLLMVASGLVTGYSWLGGSNSAAYAEIGDGWGAGAATAQTLTLIAVGFSIIALLGQLAYAAVITGTLFSGRAVSQEFLEDVEGSGEVTGE